MWSDATWSGLFITGACVAMFVILLICAFSQDKDIVPELALVFFACFALSV